MNLEQKLHRKFNRKLSLEFCFLVEPQILQRSMILVSAADDQLLSVKVLTFFTRMVREERIFVT